MKLRSAHFVVVSTVVFALVDAAHVRAQTCEDPIAGLHDCVRDADCVYTNQDQFSPCCTCANGGIEAAINKSKKAELEAYHEMCCINPGCLFFVNCHSPSQDVRCVDGACTLGTCGDSFVPPNGEDCDDGGESATCDSNCTLTECGDWTVNSTAGETCDDGNSADGDGCSSSCACDDATDADGDGVGDACDDCVNASAAASSALVSFKAVGLDPVVGDDALKLKMEFTPSVPFSELDPTATMFGLVTKDFEAEIKADFSIPGGAFDGVRGWKSNASGTSFIYVDQGDPPAVAGISKVRVSDRSAKAPGLVAVQVKGAGATYPLGPADVPLGLVVRMGSPLSGRCGEIAYTRERCKVNATGTAISCR
jgi:cysteine-rich repeat protein